MKAVRVKAGTSQASAAARKRLFIEAYITSSNNGRQAGMAAGCKNERAADQYALRMLDDVEVKEEIARRTESEIARARRNTGISIERTLRELARLGYHDIAQCFDKDGNVLEVSEMNEDARRVIAGIEVEELFAGKGESRQLVGRAKKIKFHSKPEALDKLMKHLGLFKEDNSQKPVATLPPTFVIVGVKAG